MATQDFVIELFCRVDDALGAERKHPQAKLYPSELVTLALLFALKGVGTRAFYRWLWRDLSPLFPHLPERTRLFRLFCAHHEWAERFLAEPTVLGVIDSYGIELIHPIREGRSPRQIGKKGKSNWRWIVGGKLVLVLNQRGEVVAWESATANVADAHFKPLIQRFEKHMILLADEAFHAKEGDPPNLKLCPRGHWNGRMLIETVLSMLTLVMHFKHLTHRVWDYFNMHLAFAMAAFNLLIRWHGLLPNAQGFIPLSIAKFSL
jgi:hypothetical protein